MLPLFSLNFFIRSTTSSGDDIENMKDNFYLRELGSRILLADKFFFL